METIGTYPEQFNTISGADLPPGPIFQSEGFAVHVRKRHPYCEPYIDRVAEIIAAPDYIGRNPKEPNSIELVKVLDANIQLAIKLDIKNDYLYVASLYDVPQGKIDRRLSGGRLNPFPKQS